MTQPPGAFRFSLPRPDGTTLDLAEFAGRPLLIANTASRCGFTGQYAGLQNLWDSYRDRGLIVIGVPSDDFGHQEPGTDTEIGSFCQLNYGVTFPLAAKSHVTGPDAPPLFHYLAAQAGPLAKPRWNFYKYLISPNGSVAAWFSSITPPNSARVIRALSKHLRPQTGG